MLFMWKQPAISDVRGIFRYFQNWCSGQNKTDLDEDYNYDKLWF